MPRHFDNPLSRSLGSDYDPFATEKKFSDAAALVADIEAGRIVVQEVVQQTTVDELYC